MSGLLFNFMNLQINLIGAFYIDKVHKDLIVPVPELPSLFRGMSYIHNSVIPCIFLDYILNVPHKKIGYQNFWSIIEIPGKRKSNKIGINIDLILKKNYSPPKDSLSQNLTLKGENLLKTIESEFCLFR